MTTLVAEANVVDEVPPNHGVLSILDRTGDTKIMWDRNNPDDVATARRTFDEMVTGKRFRAFSVTASGGTGTMVSAFDPNAEKLILAAPLVGG